VVLAEAIRQCLLKVERRRMLADKYGFPYRTIMPRPTEARPKRFLRVALPVAALLLAVAVIAALLLQEPIGKIVHRAGETKPVGVVIGIADSSAASAAQNAYTTTPKDFAPAVTSQATNAGVASANQPSAHTATASTGSQVSSPGLRQAETSNAESPVSAPNSSGSNSLGGSNYSSSSYGTETSVSSKRNEAAQPSTASESSSHGKNKSMASASRQARGPQDLSEDFPQRHVGSMRGRLVGITSDGRLIYRLPSGHRRVVAPDSDDREFAPRRHNRVFIDRDEETFAPPPRFPPDYLPDD